MTPSEDDHRRHDESIPIIAHRLSSLEHQMETGFASIDRRLDSLAFVPIATWNERELARDAATAAMRDDIAAAKALGMWAVGLVAGLVLTSMVGFLIWMAQGAPA